MLRLLKIEVIYYVDKNRSIFIWQKKRSNILRRLKIEITYYVYLSIEILYDVGVR